MDAGGTCTEDEYDPKWHQFMGTGAFDAISASLVDLARLFSVSTDYLLCVEKHSTVNVTGLDEKDVALLAQLADRLRNRTERDL